MLPISSAKNQEQETQRFGVVRVWKKANSVGLRQTVTESRETVPIPLCASQHTRMERRHERNWKNPTSLCQHLHKTVLYETKN